MTYYLTDGTSDGFYSAVFDAYADKEAFVTAKSRIQLSFGDRLVSVETIEEKAERVRKKLTLCDVHALDDLSILLRSSEDGTEQAAFLYIRELVHRGRPVKGRLAEPAVFDALDRIARVNEEAHRFTGFLRFTENSDGVLYAPFSPDHDILSLLVPHFLKRLPGIPFLIHDKKRHKIAVCDGKTYTFAVACDSATFVPSPEQEDWENLWKKYYRHVNVALRPHEKQMRGSMPVRYWKYLPEKNQRNSVPKIFK